jgi:hypothetical protein
MSTDNTRSADSSVKRQRLEEIKQTRAVLSMDNMKWLVEELELAWRENEAIIHAANEVIKELDGPNNELKQAFKEEATSYARTAYIHDGTLSEAFSDGYRRALEACKRAIEAVKAKGEDGNQR